MSFEWQLSTIGEFCPFKYGKGLPERVRKPGEFGVYSSAGLVGWHDTAFVNSPGIVVGRKGTVGSVTFSANPFWPIDTAFYIDDQPSARDIHFTYYLLRTLDLHLMNTDSAVPGLNRDNAHAIEVSIPPLAVQKNIADFLRLIDDRITLLRETNATLEAIAQALFKSWFLDFDPVYAKQKGKKPEGMDEATAALFPNSFENSALGEIPKGWEIKNLGQVAYNVKSRIKNAEDWKNLDLLDLSRMPRKILFPFEYGKGNELSTSVFEFKKDDCLFGAVRPYFHKVCHATRNGVTNSSVLVIRSLVPENQFFVNLVASSKKCVTHATSYSQGTKMPTINWENLSRFSIVCPPDNLQSIFCEYVSLFFKKALNNSLIINLLTELRDVLLPRLIMGQLKLPNSREINNKTMENHK